MNPLSPVPAPPVRRYQVVEVAPVSEDELTQALNRGVAQGWEFDGFHFVNREHSRRPVLCYITFIRYAEVAPTAAEETPPESVEVEDFDPVAASLSLSTPTERGQTRPRMAASPQPTPPGITTGHSSTPPMAQLDRDNPARNEEPSPQRRLPERLTNPQRGSLRTPVAVARSVYAAKPSGDSSVERLSFPKSGPGAATRPRIRTPSENRIRVPGSPHPSED